MTHRAWLKNILLVLVGSALSEVPAWARIISYAPIAPVQSVPAIQKRAARHVVLREQAGIVRPSEFDYGYLWRLVVHDSQGLESPRDITPGGTPARLGIVAALEDEDGTFRILVASGSGFLYSPDGGVTWASVSLPGGAYLVSHNDAFSSSDWDIGGPIFGATSSALRLGNAGNPFVLALATSNPSQSGFWVIAADGSARMLSIASGWFELLGADLGGTRFLVGARFFGPWPDDPYTNSSWKVAILDLAGTVQPLFEVPLGGNYTWPAIEGWITPDGAAYLTVNWYWGGIVTPLDPLPSMQSVALWKDGVLRELVSTGNSWPQLEVFAVPTPDFTGAWIARMGSADTVLMSHSGDGAVRDVWRDASRPFIWTVHAAASGSRLLIRTRRFQGYRYWNGLAVWHVGEPPPSSYDELLVRPELGGLGFVHLDVDAVDEGAPFLFDAGATLPPTSGPSAASGGGGGKDVYQSGGVIRASLRQQLVIPASARAPGRFGATWRTDLVLRNPEREPVRLSVRLLPNPETTGAAADAAIVLAGASIQVLPDVLATLFHLEQGSGALLLVPEAGRSIEATSRTYTTSPTGTFGMGVGSVDMLTAAGPAFPLTFSAGLLGEGFRTNLVVTDATGRGTQLEALLSTAEGKAEIPLPVSLPANGQTQLNDMATLSGAPASTVGSQTVTPKSGWVLAGSIAIDDRTNDPAWFGPDSVPDAIWAHSIIPAVVHAAGAKGAQYRTDLFLFNADESSASVRLSVKDWYRDENEQDVDLTLSGRESRVIRDVLWTLFGRSGVARLALSGAGTGRLGIRATSRIYDLASDGSTHGMALPALGWLQTARDGDTIEILGPTGGAGFRTNLSIVHLGYQYAPPSTVHVEIVDPAGVVADAFEVSVPSGRGLQIDDLFHTRGLGDGPVAALIRLSISTTDQSASLAAYATTIDNGTNDPVYYGANLAACSTSAVTGFRTTPGSDLEQKRSPIGTGDARPKAGSFAPDRVRIGPSSPGIGKSHAITEVPGIAGL